MCVGGGGGGGGVITHNAYVEDNLKGSVFIFHHVGPGKSDLAASTFPAV